MASDKVSVTDLKQVFAGRADNLNKLVAPPAKKDVADPALIKSLNSFSSVNKLLNKDLSSLKSSLDKLVVALTPAKSYKAKVDQQSITNDILKKILNEENKNSNGSSNGKGILGSVAGGVGSFVKSLTPLKVLGIGGLIGLLLNGDIGNFGKGLNAATIKGINGLTAFITTGDTKYLKTMFTDMKKSFTTAIPNKGILGWLVHGDSKGFLQGIMGIVGIGGHFGKGLITGNWTDFGKNLIDLPKMIGQIWNSMGDQAKFAVAGAISIQVGKSIVSSFFDPTKMAQKANTAAIIANTMALGGKGAAGAATTVAKGILPSLIGGAGGTLVGGAAAGAGGAAAAGGMIGAVVAAAIPIIIAAAVTYGVSKTGDVVTDKLSGGIYTEGWAEGLADFVMTGGQLGANRRKYADEKAVLKLIKEKNIPYKEAKYIVENADKKYKSGELVLDYSSITARPATPAQLKELANRTFDVYGAKQEANQEAIPSGTPSTGSTLNRDSDFYKKSYARLKQEEGSVDFTARYEPGHEAGTSKPIRVIGHGHTFTDKDKSARYVNFKGRKNVDLATAKLTLAEMDELLTQDYERYYNKTSKFAGFDNLNDNQKQALMDISYQTGNVNRKEFVGLSDAVAKNDYNEINRILSQDWYTKYDKGKRKNRNVVALYDDGSGNLPSNSSINTEVADAGDNKVELGSGTMSIFEKLFEKFDTGGDQMIMQTLSSVGVFG